jgi:hypothetical protein
MFYYLLVVCGAHACLPPQTYKSEKVCLAVGNTYRSVGYYTSAKARCVRVLASDLVR